jgi:hypothetical protein
MIMVTRRVALVDVMSALLLDAQGRDSTCPGVFLPGPQLRAGAPVLACGGQTRLAPLLKAPEC